MMTGLDAWQIISANLSELYRFRDTYNRHFLIRTQEDQPYSEKEVEAEVLCYMALKKLDEVEE